MNNPVRLLPVALVAAGLATGAVAPSAHADLTVQGAVGLPNNPTAQVPAENGIRAQINYNDADGDGELYGIAAATRIGTSPFEINGAIHQLNADDSDTGFSVGAKYLFSRETEPAGVRLAAGVGYTTFSDFDLDNLYGYVVASKSLNAVAEGRPSITGHLGVRYDSFEIAGSDSDEFSLFAGVEVPLTRNGAFQAVGEVGTDQIEGGETPYSLSVRYRRDNQPFGASIGVARNPYSDGLFAQLGYTFDS